MARFKAKLTSKNQLTLPAGISAFLHARPGDVVTFTLDEGSGEVRVTGPDLAGVLESWSGRWVAGGHGSTPSDTDRFIRELRGERE